MSDAGPTSFVVSAPSGAGKTSLADNLLGRLPDLQRTISCTTRAPRQGERHGKDYFFVSEDEFRRRADAGEFLEWAEVHGHLYGTLVAEVDRIHAAGHDAVLVIDVQGAASVRQRLDPAVTVFVLPPSRQALIERLEGRDGLGGGAGRARRVQAAQHEIKEYVSYDYLVLNDDFETAADELAAIVVAERCRTARRDNEAARLLADFGNAASD